MRGSPLVLVTAWGVAWGVACGAQAPGATIVFDPCEVTAVAAPGASAEQLASVDDAIAMWRANGVTGLVRGGAAAITVEFRAGATALYGQYDDASATVYVNTRVAERAARAIVIAHELGHALGLPHVAAAARSSVMNPGNLTISPDAADAAALAALWGACPAAAEPRPE